MYPYNFPKIVGYGRRPVSGRWPGAKRHNVRSSSVLRAREFLALQCLACRDAIRFARFIARRGPHGDHCAAGSGRTTGQDQGRSDRRAGRQDASRPGPDPPRRAQGFHAVESASRRRRYHAGANRAIRITVTRKLLLNFFKTKQETVWSQPSKLFLRTTDHL